MRYSRLITYPITVLLLATVCLVFCPILTASSQISTTVIVKPSTVSTHVAESFDVTISISNVQNLYGLEVILSWNPAVLRATNVDIRLGVETFSDGVLHESSYSPSIFLAENNLTQTEGEYRLVATSMASAPSFNGSGTIVRITFEPTNLGNSTLDLESQLFDYPPTDRDPRISFPINHSTQDSSVTVKTSTPTQSTNPAPTQTPTQSPTSEPSTLTLKTEHALAIFAVIIITVVLILLVLRRRK